MASFDNNHDIGTPVVRLPPLSARPQQSRNSKSSKPYPKQKRPTQIASHRRNMNLDTEAFATTKPNTDSLLLYNRDDKRRHQPRVRLPLRDKQKRTRTKHRQNGQRPQAVSLATLKNPIGNTFDAASGTVASSLPVADALPPSTTSMPIFTIDEEVPVVRVKLPSVGPKSQEVAQAKGTTGVSKLTEVKALPIGAAPAAVKQPPTIEEEPKNKQLTEVKNIPSIVALTAVKEPSKVKEVPTVKDVRKTKDHPKCKEVLRKVCKAREISTAKEVIEVDEFGYWMGGFKRAATQAQARKAKGDWIIPGSLNTMNGGSTKAAAIPATSSGSSICYLTDMIPGEIRNRIYEYVYDETVNVIFTKTTEETGRITELLTKGDNDEAARHMFVQRSVAHPPRRGEAVAKGGVKPYKMSKVNWATSMSALMITCKKIHQEVASMIYGSNITFSFHSLKPLRAFLTHVPKSSLAHVTSLSLLYRTAGEPSLSEDRRIKWTHDKAWFNTLKLVPDCLPNLKKLRLVLDIRESPLHFELDQDWVLPLFYFSDCPKLRDGGDVKVTLCSPWLPTPVKSRIYLNREWQQSGILKVPQLHNAFAEVLRLAIHDWDDEAALHDYEKLFWVGPEARQFRVTAKNFHEPGKYPEYETDRCNHYNTVNVYNTDDTVPVHPSLEMVKDPLRATMTNAAVELSGRGKVAMAFIQRQGKRDRKRAKQRERELQKANQDGATGYQGNAKGNQNDSKGKGKSTKEGNWY